MILTKWDTDISREKSKFKTLPKTCEQSFLGAGRDTPFIPLPQSKCCVSIIWSKFGAIFPTSLSMQHTETVSFHLCVLLQQQTYLCALMCSAVWMQPSRGYQVH